MSLHLENFPILKSAAVDPSDLERIMGLVRRAIEVGSISNIDYKIVQLEIVNAAVGAWHAHVSGPFFEGDKWRLQPKLVDSLHDSILIHSLDEIVATAKKVRTIWAAGPAFEAMRAYCAEVSPLAEAVLSLKDKIAKAREPSSKQPKVLKTCPVCSREIAVVNGKMARHGHKRGGQSEGCKGSGLPPLEEGTNP